MNVKELIAELIDLVDKGHGKSEIFIGSEVSNGYLAISKEDIEIYRNYERGISIVSKEKE